jgi:hypothetical protein
MILAPTFIHAFSSAWMIAQAAALTCRPHAPIESPWALQELAPDLVQFYGRIAAADGTGLDVELGSLSDSYHRRLYTLGEFEGQLSSLRNLVAKRRRDLDVLAPAAAEPRSRERAAGSDPLILYLDPACESCTRVLLLSLEMERTCPSEAPDLILRTLPASTEISLDAAVLLKKVELDSPAQFLAAFLEVATVVPANPGMFDEVAAHYLGTGPWRTAPWVRELRAQVERERRAVRELMPARDFPAPLLLFHGRVIQRQAADRFPFDPLHDGEALLRTVEMISAFDRTAAYQTGR